MGELIDFIVANDDAFKSKSRLISLYSDFSLTKSANPEGYVANTSAWRSALSRAARAGKTFGGSVLTLSAGPALVRALEKPGLGRPAALGAVFDEAIRAGQMIPVADFFSRSDSVYNKSWLPTLRIPTPLEIARWGFALVGLVGGHEQALKEGEVVVMANIEEAANAVLKAVQQKASTSSALVYSSDTFAHDFSTVFSTSHLLTTQDLKILTTYLVRDRRAASTATSATTGQTVLKFAGSAAESPPAPVDQQDITIANLHMLAQTLTGQIDALEQRVTQLNGSLRAALAKTPPNKTVALAQLRAKKLHEATAAKRFASLEQVQAVLADIDDAVGQVQMMAAMESSAGVLKNLNRKVGGVEGVQRVMDRVREGQEEVSEITQVIVEGEMGRVDDAEVDDEFERLLEESGQGKKNQNEETQSEKDDQVHVRLPDVPTGEVGDAEKEKEMEKRLSTMSIDDKPAARPETAEQS